MINTTKLGKFESALETAVTEYRNTPKQCVAEAFVAIEKYLGKNVPLQKVLQEFNANYGLAVKLPRFRQLLRAERTSRNPPATSPATTA